MAKITIKILKPVTIGGAIHRPNKLGNLAEVEDKHARTLIEGGYAEAAPKGAKPTFGVTISPQKPPMVVDLKTGDPAPGTPAAEAQAAEAAENEEKK